MSMSKWMLSVLALLTAPALAEQAEVYLVASVQLGGSNLAQSIFLHEPQITTLEECQEAVRVGQRDRDWQRYHHIFMRDRFQGFTGHLDYRLRAQHPAFQRLARPRPLQPSLPDQHRRAGQSAGGADIEPGAVCHSAQGPDAGAAGDQSLCGGQSERVVGAYSGGVSSSGLRLSMPGRWMPLSATCEPSSCGWVTQVRMS